MYRNNSELNRIKKSRSNRNEQQFTNTSSRNENTKKVIKQTSVETRLFIKIPQSSRKNQFICFCNKPEGTCNYKYCKFAHSEMEFKFTPDVELLYNIIKKPKKYFDFFEVCRAELVRCLFDIVNSNFIKADKNSVSLT